MNQLIAGLLPAIGQPRITLTKTRHKNHGRVLKSNNPANSASTNVQNKTLRTAINCCIVSKQTADF